MLNPIKCQEGSLVRVDEGGWIWARQSRPENGLTRQFFVLASEATDEDFEDCNTLVVDWLSHISEVVIEN